MRLATQEHFERLAASWGAKYAPGGGMLPRVQQFLDVLLESCLAPADVLDFGCGTGEIARACAQSGYRVCGVDLSIQMIKAAQKRDIEGLVVFRVLVNPRHLELPFASASFNAILASSVFEYVANPSQCFTELRRISRPGAIMLLTVPNLVHRIRRFESFIKPLARVSRPILSGAARDWEEYLSLSTQRLSLAEWSQQLGKSGWTVRSIRGHESPLSMIVVKSR